MDSAAPNDFNELSPSPGVHKGMPSRALKFANRLQHAALATLIAGLVGGALIYALAPDQSAVGTTQIVNGHVEVIAPEDDPHYEYEVERMGGRSGVYMDRFQRWFAHLWHGPTLGITLGVLALVSAAGMSRLAREFERDHDRDLDNERRRARSGNTRPPEP